MATKSKGRKSNSLGAHGHKDRKSARFRDTKAKDGNKESLAFRVLSSTQTKELAELETVEQVQDKMSETMGISGFDVDLKEAAILDYYTAGFWWSKEQHHSHEQMSAFFTVIHTLLENVKEKHLNVVENLKEYKKMLVGIGMENAEISGGLDCFDVNQSKAITDYMYMSLFQHYKMYEFMFSHTQAEEIIGTDLVVEVAPPADVPWPCPLEEAIADDVHRDHIASPAPTPQDQAEEEGAGGDESGEAEPAAGAEGVAPEGSTEDVSGVLSQLTPDEVKAIMKGVMDEMVVGLQSEVAQKLRDKENVIIQRINKIHKVADK